MAATAKKSIRNSLTAGIHAAWAELRPELRRDAEESKTQRLAYVRAVTGFDVSSMSDLSEAALGDVLSALRKELGPREKRVIANNVVEGQFGKTKAVVQATPAEVSSIAGFASARQVWAITRIFDWLQYPTDKRTEWLQKKYRRSTVEKLSFHQADSAIRVLLNIAVVRWLKAEHDRPISQAEIKANLDNVKRLIGIGKKGGGK